MSHIFSLYSSSVFPLLSILLRDSFFLSPCICLTSKLYYLAAYLLCLTIYQLPSPALSPFFLSSVFPGGLPFVIDPCPGCLGIDWLSPCHWSSLSILTRFAPPLRCGQRVGERGRYIRCSTARGDEIKMNERESKTERGGEENDGGRVCVTAGQQPCEVVAL